MKLTLHRIILGVVAVCFVLLGALFAPVMSFGAGHPASAQASVVHVLYFYSVDCTHCKAVEEEVLLPLKAQHGAQLDVMMLEIGTPANYELLIRAEEQFGVPASERGLPTVVVGDNVIIGEDDARAQLAGLVADGLFLGGTPLPDIEGLDEAVLSDGLAGGADGNPDACAPDSGADACAPAEPIWVAYFYQVGCQECSRAEADIHYIRSKYPQFTVEEFNIYDDTALADWLAGRAGRLDDLHSPAIFVGDEALIGKEEITPQNLESVVEKYAVTGAPRVWAEFDAAAAGGLVERFRSLGPLTVVFAGLVDGLNPCAFATLIFFVSYLTISGRKGRDALLVGAAFTLGVFLAYLLIGLGFYKVLDLLGDVLTTLGRWVYGLTALLCAALAVFSFLDYLKARRGDIGDMALNLPHALRMRINATIRQGRHARAFVVGAFVTGVVISLLELACTGQVYLPTIIFVSSIPELRVRAISYLLLYNLLFILPLIVVFVLAYYGTTSKDLTRFLQKNAAAVKLGMVVLFASLAIWLGLSLLL